MNANLHNAAAKRWRQANPQEQENVAREARRTAWLEEQVARIRNCDNAVEILRDACEAWGNVK